MFFFGLCVHFVFLTLLVCLFVLYYTLWRFGGLGNLGLGTMVFMYVSGMFNLDADLPGLWIMLRTRIGVGMPTLHYAGMHLTSLQEYVQLW